MKGGVMSNLVTVIDFSSSGIRLVAGYYFKGTVYALQALEGDRIPLDGNGYLDKKKAEESLALLLEEARSKLKNDLGVYIALLPPDGFIVKSGEGKTTTVDPSSRIIQIDYVNCIHQVNKLAKLEGKHIVYDDPSLFADDNKKDYDTFPLGSMSDQLEVFADAEMVDEESFRHYESILMDLHLDIYMYLVAPFCSVAFLNFFGAPKSYIALDIEKDYCYLSYVSKHRMNDSKIIRFGLDEAINESGSLLNLSPEMTKDYMKLFGLRAESGFMFITNEGKTLQETSECFKKAFSKLVGYVREFIKSHDLADEVPLIILGSGGEIEGLDSYFVEELKRDDMVFSAKVIGARNRVFTNCLGALLVSSFNYQSPIQEARKKEGTQQFRNAAFSRSK